MKIKRALISVSDKQGIAEFARELGDLGVEILSTGGTAALLRNQNIPVKDVAEFTGFPEMLEGRIKTLHPRVHGGILARRNKQDHMDQVKQHGLDLIDLVCVNLYPFAETILGPGCSLEEAIEQIDIGGPTMLRSAAKNFEHVVVVVDPLDYKMVLEELKKGNGEVSRDLRFKLARKVFGTTAFYDAAISNYLDLQTPKEESNRFPGVYITRHEKVSTLRYGENPHQQAAFYRDITPSASGIATAKQLHGKAMSFNNYQDADAAVELVREFSDIATVIIKHSNPCGVGLGKHPKEAYLRAKETDPVSAFGGVIAFNRPVDGGVAKEISSMFVEIVVAPGFSPDALEILTKKKDLRLLDLGKEMKSSQQTMEMKSLVGGVLLQDRDLGRIEDIRSLKVASKRSPSDDEYEAMAFAWVVAKHVKSNAIVFARKGQTVGVGAGQMSRVDSVKIATIKAQVPLKGSVMASDAFFPFRDGIDEASKVGATAIIQPGGSIRDQEVIQAVDEHNMAMILTGMRHFRH